MRLQCWYCTACQFQQSDLLCYWSCLLSVTSSTIGLLLVFGRQSLTAFLSHFNVFLFIFLTHLYATGQFEMNKIRRYNGELSVARMTEIGKWSWGDCGRPLTFPAVVYWKVLFRIFLFVGSCFREILRYLHTRCNINFSSFEISAGFKIDSCFPHL